MRAYYAIYRPGIGKIYEEIGGRVTVALDDDRKPNQAHFVISDEMPATVHPANGKVYESKRAFDAASRAAGLVPIDKGGVETCRRWRREEREAKLERHMEQIAEKVLG